MTDLTHRGRSIDEFPAPEDGAAPWHGGDCWGVITSLGYNLDSDGSCGFTQATDLLAMDAQLGPLQDNGGPTLTHNLDPGSPATNAVPAGDCAIATDQRGEDRSQGDGCDIGAVER